MAKKIFQIEEYYILTKNKNNWKSVKGMLDLPIWKPPTGDTESDKYEEELKEIRDKKGLKKKAKEEVIEKLEKRKFDKELEKVRITYGTFLRAVGDLICEKGDPPGLSASSIKSKFETLAEGDYDIFSEKLEKRIKVGELKGIAQEKKIKDYKKTIEEAKQRDLKELKQMNNGRGIIVVNKIDSLNRWLDNNCPAVFIRKVGENYKLLVYYAEGIEGETEYFCSDKNRDKFIEIVNKNKRDIQTLKNKFESIVGLQTLEEVLEPPPQLEEEFFPIGGPYNYNFVNGWVLRRPEVSDIIIGVTPNFGKKRSFNKVQFLVGDPATGKTVIARNVGLKLQENKWQVYHISGSYIKDQVSDISQGLNYLENISNRTLVIIEDIHKCPSESAQLIDKIANPNKKVRFLITGTSSFDRYLKRNEKIVFERCERRELKREKLDPIIGSIISKYKEKQKCERKKDFDKFSSEHRKQIIEETDGNLWILSYFLRAWAPEKGIDMEMVYDLVNKDIEDLDKEFEEEHDLRGVTKVLLTLAPFSIFEVGVSKSFFNEEYGVIKISPKTLKKLVKYGEITYDGGFYSIPHSTIAQLYIETATNNYPDLLIDLTDQLEGNVFSGKIKNYPLRIYQSYLQKRPENYGEIVYKICSYESTYGGCGGVGLRCKRLEGRRNVPLKKLLMDDNTFEALTSVLNESKDIRNIGLFLFGLWFARCSSSLNKIKEYVQEEDFISQKEINKFVKKIDIDHLVSKIENEEFVYNISECLQGIEFCKDDGFQKSIVHELNLVLIKDKMKDDVVSFLTCSNIVKSLVCMCEKSTNLFLDALIKKVRVTNSPMDTLLGLQTLYETKLAKIYLSVRKNVNIDVLLSQIEKRENNLEEVFWCLYHLTDIILKDKKYSDKLMNFLPSKIDRSKEIGSSIYCMAKIGNYGENGIKRIDKIIDTIDSELFRSKINDNKWALANLWHQGKKHQKQEIAEHILNKLDLWSFMDEKRQKNYDDFIHDYGDYKKLK